MKPESNPLPHVPKEPDERASEGKRRQYPEQPIVAVGAAVCRLEHQQDVRVLIVRRGKAPSKGVWTVPGGAVELGETMREAAAREVHEECGIEVDVGKVVGILDNIIRDEQARIQYHYAIIDFAAQYVSGDLCPSDELMEAAWIKPEQFEAYGVPHKARKVCLEALAIYHGPHGPQFIGG
jgi:ADP-ribose pyrophosphatase YjhB (NUDIX family)